MIIYIDPTAAPEPTACSIPSPAPTIPDPNKWSNSRSNTWSNSRPNTWSNSRSNTWSNTWSNSRSNTWSNSRSNTWSNSRSNTWSNKWSNSRSNVWSKKIYKMKEYKLVWTFSLRNIINPNDKTIGISLLGQCLSILTGFVDQQYGNALTVRLFKINTNNNFVINNNLEFEDDAFSNIQMEEQLLIIRIRDYHQMIREILRNLLLKKLNQLH